MSSNSGGVAFPFSKKSRPISYEIEEIVKGRFLKVKAKFEKTIMTLKCLCSHKRGERIDFLYN